MERTRKNKFPGHSNPPPPPDRIGPVILACDPSFTAWGYAVVWDEKVLSTGCIKTSPEAKKRRIREGDDRVRRTQEIVLELLKVIKESKVNLILSELPHGSQNAKAAVMIGIVVGIIQALSDALEIPVEWYSENDAKKAVLGRITASKAEMIEAIDDIYELPWQDIKYIDEAVADAMAIYHTARINSPILKFLRR